MKENQLIFLISQPRSGSTLLQKLLSQNSQIHSTSEPWLMMHPAYSLKRFGIYAEYNKVTEHTAFTNFIDNLPDGGKDLYIKKLRSTYLSLYEAYIRNTEKTRFLDKTPRYYFIWSELYEIFPEAKFIILRRNPISVLYSMIVSWNDNKWHQLSRFKHDLLTAINNLSEMLENNIGLHVKYEDLVDTPEKTLHQISSYIDLPFEESMLSYDNKEKWQYGDQNFIYSLSNISSDRKLLWQDSDLSPQTWRILSDYLEWIGKERFDRLGYNFSDTRSALDNNLPASSFDAIVTSTFPLNSLLDDTINCLYENIKLKDKILKQEEEEKFFMQIRQQLESHSKMNIFKQPIAKFRSYRYLLSSYNSLSIKNNKKRD